MNNQIATNSFVKELLDLLEETFERTQGIFLDRGNSLFDTLEKISADGASQSNSTGRTTVAGHTEHIRYYIKVLESCIRKTGPGDVDWRESWRIKKVTSEEWTDLRTALREAYDGLISVLKQVEAWEGEDDIGASLAILAHTSYHLGAIRQIMPPTK